MSKQRIVELQKSLRIAREALERIKYGNTHVEAIAEEALEKLWKLEPKQQLQGIVGHERKPSIMTQPAADTLEREKDKRREIAEIAELQSR